MWRFNSNILFCLDTISKRQIISVTFSVLTNARWETILNSYSDDVGGNHSVGDRIFRYRS